VHAPERGKKPDIVTSGKKERARRSSATLRRSPRERISRMVEELAPSGGRLSDGALGEKGEAKFGCSWGPERRKRPLEEGSPRDLGGGKIVQQKDSRSPKRKLKKAQGP